MPDPLAIPAMVTVLPLMVAVADAPLGKVSVVMMALAASSQPASLARRSPSASVMRFAVVGSPITPVDAVKISVFAQPSALDAASTLSATNFSPALPVKATELPALTKKARAVPPLSASRPQRTAADAVVDVVKTPATCVSGASSANSTSGRPL